MLAAWLASLLAYLFLVLGPKFLDRDSGVLGKFYLFRPSSLIVLLWLMLVLAVAVHVRDVARAAARGAAGDGRPGISVYSGRSSDAGDRSRTVAVEGQKAILAAAVTRLTAPGDVVLIDPDVELQWLDFERRTGRRPG